MVHVGESWDSAPGEAVVPLWRDPLWGQRWPPTVASNSGEDPAWDGDNLANLALSGAGNNQDRDVWEKFEVRREDSPLWFPQLKNQFQ